MNRLIGLALGAAIGLAWPVCAAERVTTELVIVHIDQEGRKFSETTQRLPSEEACQIERVWAIVKHWKAVGKGYRSGMKAWCVIIDALSA